MKRKLIAIIAAATLVMCAAVPAFAADPVDGTVPTAPSGGTAYVTKEADGKMHSEFDEDAKLKANDDDGTQIQVWAKVVSDASGEELNEDGNPITYKVDIGWGFMKFQYQGAARVWDPATHTYTNGTGNAAWTVASYLDATNNKITVTNHSNARIFADMNYAADGVAFNDAPTANDSVVGNFFKTNDLAKVGARVLTGTYDAGAVKDGAVPGRLRTDADNKSDGTADRLFLPTADGTQLAAAPTNDAYFAFSGTPDLAKGNADGTLKDFTKVGTITVNISKDPSDTPPVTP